MVAIASLPYGLASPSYELTNLPLALRERYPIIGGWVWSLSPWAGSG